MEFFVDGTTREQGEKFIHGLHWQMIKPSVLLLLMGDLMAMKVPLDVVMRTMTPSSS